MLPHHKTYITVVHPYLNPIGLPPLLELTPFGLTPKTNFKKFVHPHLDDKKFGLPPFGPNEVSPNWGLVQLGFVQMGLGKSSTKTGKKRSQFVFDDFP